MKLSQNSFKAYREEPFEIFKGHKIQNYKHQLRFFYPANYYMKFIKISQMVFEFLFIYSKKFNSKIIQAKNCCLLVQGKKKAFFYTQLTQGQATL